MALTAVLSVGFCFAGETSGIASANTVGYTSDTLVKGKFNLISLPFSAVSGGASKLADAMTGSWHGGMTADEGDQIKVWDASIGGYSVYYYYEDDTHEWDGWYDFSGSYYFDDCEENKDGLEAGWTAWYLSRGDKDPVVTMAGEVASEDDISITIYGGGFNMIANPFPVSFQPNDNTQVDWGDIHAGMTADDGDQIKLWDASVGGYNVFYYYADDSHEWDGWYDFSGSYYFEDVVKNGIAVGQPFWYLSRDTKGVKHTVKFLSPLRK